MHYFMVRAAKEILFSTGILFIHLKNSKWGFSKDSIFFCEIFRFCQIQRPFRDQENEFVIICACALSAWTYNAEVQGSDARIRNSLAKTIYAKYV